MFFRRPPPPPPIADRIKHIEEILDKMAHTLAEVQGVVDALGGKVDKVLADLKAALAQVGQMTPEQQAAIDSVFDGVSAVSTKLDPPVA